MITAFNVAAICIDFLTYSTEMLMKNKLTTKLLLKAVVFSLLFSFVYSQSCPSFLDETERRDCYPWPGGDQATCEARGCIWCTSSTGGVPWCFYDDEACASTIPESSRVDCHPEPDMTRESCTAKGCMYCPSATGGIPWCFNDPDVDPGGARCPAIPDAERVDCLPVDGATQQDCIAKGCYWCAAQDQGAPYCFTSPSIGYKMVGVEQATPKGFAVDLARVNTPSWFGEDISDLRMEVEFHENHRLRIKLFDPSTTRYEVPLTIPSPASIAPNPLYDVQYSNDPAFNFKVIRQATGETLFDTSLGGLQFSEQYLQFATRLPSSNVYGFGETEHDSFRHDMNWTKWGMWARDEPVTNTNIYGVHPYMTALDSQNNMFGLLILNSNAQEVELTPAPGLIYRTIGGVLDLYFFLGPTPENVAEQYTEAVGRPVMPPYWMLGFHLSRYGYDSLANMSGVVDRMRQYDIPHDVQHCDIDHFDRRLSFTYDRANFSGLPEYIRQLKTEGTRVIIILDPFIGTGEPQGTYGAFERGQQADVWLKESDGVTPAESTCWPDGTVYYPDLSSQSGMDWWINECTLWHDTIEFDALWVDMNEPASFSEGSITGCNDNKLTRPPFKPRAIWGTLAEKTLCADYQSAFGNHYNTHSLFGWSCGGPSIDAARAATGTRSYAIIRSTFPGLGKFGGHWLGDNNAEWDHLRYSIIGMLEFNMFGIPFVGADICGYFTDSWPEICSRWMQLGSFYTFSRNHNGKGWTEQDPGRWPEVAAVSRTTLHIRYSMLPYLYTLFYESHVFGRTVVRPLLNEFTADPDTHGVDRQFMWGPGVLITPVLDDIATSVQGYFPDTRWYSYYNGAELPARGANYTLFAPVDFIPIHFRGGHVIPTQEPANSTVFSRSNPMGLTVALDDSGAASGLLYWDDGETLDTYETGVYFLANYQVTPGSLVGAVQFDGYSGVSPLIFSTVDVYGQDTAVTSVTIDGSDWPSFLYDSDTQVLQIFSLNIPVYSDFTIIWS